MVLRVCRGCTALFPPGLARCPQCGADDHYEQGSEDDMPKISRAQGVSYDEATVAAASEQNEALPGLEVGAEQPAEDQVDEDAYDPADYTVIEVNEYLAECQQDGNEVEYERVLAAERTGKARSGILNRG
jgi:hypothetical protein